LVFLDVDGPLIRSPPARTVDVVPVPTRSPKRATLSWTGSTPRMAGGLLGLGGQLVWATTWMADAKEIIPPRLGLPDLLVLDWPDIDEEVQHGLHGKTAFLTRWAAGRPTRYSLGMASATWANV
jgi:hypothetical protein